MTAPIFDPTPIDRAEWLQWRRQGIGASEVAAIVGESPWATADEIWADKISPDPPVELDTDPIRWGHALEPLILDEYERITGVPVVNRQARVVDPDHPWRRCTLDGTTPEETPPEPINVEAKNSMFYPWTDGPPDYYRIQTCWQMGLTRYRITDLIALHHGNTPRIYRLEFDERLFEVLCERVDEFWTNVVTRRHPDPEAIEATPEIIELVQTIATNSATRLAAEKAEKAAKAELLRRLDSHTSAHVNGVPIVTAKASPRDVTDTEGLITALALATRATPDEIRAQFTKQTTPNPTIRPTKANLKELQNV